jgi:Ca-activated chloride channel family protein
MGQKGMERAVGIERVPEKRVVQIALVLTALIAVAGVWPWLLPPRPASPALFLLTPDQAGQRRFLQGEFEQASARFESPAWRATALYRMGEFEEAAGLYAGGETAEAHYNHGNALAFQGKYEAAAEQYTRALQKRPDWEAARVNLAIAQTQMERLKKEGGDMTGGMLGADDIQFTKGKSGGDSFETVEESVPNAKEMRSIWLRQVQTNPADFLKNKFAYQHALGGANEPESTNGE